MFKIKMYLLGRIAHYYNTLHEIHSTTAKLYDKLLDSTIGSPEYYDLNEKILEWDSMVDSIITRIDETNDFLNFIYSLEKK